MPDFQLQGDIIEPNTLVPANDTYEKELDIWGMAGAISLHIITDQDVTVNMKCSNLEDSFVTPNGWTDIAHSAGEGFYEIAIPICLKAKIVIATGGTGTRISASMAGA